MLAHTVIVGLLAEREMVHVEGGVDMVSHHFVVLDHILEAVMPNMEVSWHSLHFNITLQPAAMLRLELFLNPVK